MLFLPKLPASLRRDTAREINPCTTALIKTSNCNLMEQVSPPRSTASYTAPLSFYVVGFGFIWTNISMAPILIVLSCPHLSLASSHCDVDESAGVYHALICSALWLLLLLLWLDLRIDHVRI